MEPVTQVTPEGLCFFPGTRDDGLIGFVLNPEHGNFLGRVPAPSPISFNIMALSRLAISVESRTASGEKLWLKMSRASPNDIPKATSCSVLFAALFLCYSGYLACDACFICMPPRPPRWRSWSRPLPSRMKAPAHMRVGTTSGRGGYSYRAKNNDGTCP